MALTPVQNQALMREVDDAVRQDEVANFWKRFGIPVVAAIVAGLVVFGGWLLWQDHRRKEAEATSEAFSAMQRQAPGSGAGAAALAGLKTADQPGYRAAALLADAGIKGDAKGAVSAYRAIAGDAELALPYRNLALVRQTALEFDALPPQSVIDRLKPLAEAGGPWFGSAGEMTALAYLKLGKRDLAGALFAAMAKDSDVPRTIQTRAVQMASLLGVDAVIARQPGEGKDDVGNAQ